MRKFLPLLICLSLLGCSDVDSSWILFETEKNDPKGIAKVNRVYPMTSHGLNSNVRQTQIKCESRLRLLQRTTADKTYTCEKFKYYNHGNESK